MAQFSRPNGDVTVGTYLDDAGGTSNLYSSLTDTTNRTAEYVHSVVTPVSVAYVHTMSSVTDPGGLSGRYLRYWYGKDTSAGDQIDYTIQVRTGYVSEASLGTLITEATHTNIPNGETAGTLALPSAALSGTVYLRHIFNKP